MRGPPTPESTHADRAAARAAGNVAACRVFKVFLARAIDASATAHAYVIMLLSMSFSFEIFVAIILGLTIGRSLFVSSDDLRKSSGRTLCCEATTPRELGDPLAPRFELSKQADILEPLLVRAEISVQGMMCGSCSRTVECSLLALDGIQHVDVSLPQQLAVVVFFCSAVTPAKICEVITDVGFSAALLRESPLLPGRHQPTGSQASTPDILDRNESKVCSVDNKRLEEPLLGSP